jgi:hypothetical protein
MKRLFVCENCGKIFMENADGTVGRCFGHDICSEQCANEFMNRKERKMKKDELSKIMNKTIDPKQLAFEQAEAYRGYIYSKLSDLMAEIADVDENTDVEKFAEKYCFDSSSGDYMGQDNCVIDFGYGDNADIVEALTKIVSLYRYAKGLRQ